MTDLFGRSLANAPELAPYTPQLSFLLDDLSVLSDAALASRNLDELSTLALWAQRDSRRPRHLLESLGARRLLARQLELRFGELTQALSTKLSSASEQQVLVWSERILSADSAAAVLDG